MKVAEKIREKINRLPVSEPFGYAQLGISTDSFYTAAKALERLQKQGVIKKVSKGIFYKPQMSVFGELPPNYNAMLNTYLYQNGKRIGYVTGTTIYNELNLTTQVPNITKIAVSSGRKTLATGFLKTKMVKANTEVTEDNYQLLSILDALKDFKEIPDLDKRSGISILSTKLKELTIKDQKMIVGCAMSYPPRVRAFLGALMENINAKTSLVSLKKSLNPLSEYTYGINDQLLPTASNWNIK